MNGIRKYIFCCNPRIGSIYAGFYSLISSAIFLGLLFMRFVGIQLNPVESTKDQVVLSSTLAVFILFMVASSFLIVMAFKNRKNYFRPWLACAVISIVEGTAMLMWHIVTERRDVGKVEHWEIIIIAYHSCNVVITGYCMTFVYSQYQVLKRASASSSPNDQESEIQSRGDRSSTDVTGMRVFTVDSSVCMPPPYAEKPPPYFINNGYDDSDEDDDDGGGDEDSEDNEEQEEEEEEDSWDNCFGMSFTYPGVSNPRLTFVQTLSGRIPLQVPPPAYDDIARETQSGTPWINGTSIRNDRTTTQNNRTPTQNNRTPTQNNRTPTQNNRTPTQNNRTPFRKNRTKIQNNSIQNQGERTSIRNERTPSDESDMRQTDMTETSITGTYVALADMAQADMAQANMAQANMAQADRAQADMAQADMAQANTSNEHRHASRRPCSGINLVKTLLTAGILEESKV